MDYDYDHEKQLMAEKRFQKKQKSTENRRILEHSGEKENEEDKELIEVEDNMKAEKSSVKYKYVGEKLLTSDYWETTEPAAQAEHWQPVTQDSQ